jgi:predicted Zn-dependent protease with MMP-like domain
MVSRLDDTHIAPMTDGRASEPNAADIERLARDAIRRLSPTFRDYLSDVVIRVEEFADGETLRLLGLSDPWSLSGLYQGHPISEQSIWSSGNLPPIIRLYRAPLVREWIETGVALDDLVAHVTIHEIGHHFGLSDAQMHAIEEDSD